MMRLYKYKTIEHIEDIIVNSRLYCSRFDCLNDPMEWAFTTDCGKQALADIIRDTGKDKWRICCLSKLKQNGLMWSMYGDEHRGVCVEVEVDESIFSPYDRDITNVNKYYGDIDYVDNPVNITKLDIGSIKRVLWTKSVQWKHESEVRFVHKLCNNETTAYLPVQIKCIYLGKRMDLEDIQYIKRMCKAFNIDCKKMDSSDAPEINYWSINKDTNRND